jgi:hypothetical protein
MRDDKAPPASPEIEIRTETQNNPVADDVTAEARLTVFTTSKTINSFDVLCLHAFPAGCVLRMSRFNVNESL